ncbi:HesB/YadR/YfhF family protein [Paenibacillus tengchongensis]|uniref:HesB/YadR/YfhF family protein n=1 Tax=Paenibacillus tengchongensis TaxID=2608684 RepID=UPI00124DF135|nr:hypothetical protein [Paenibacillus tengchongensis]
MIMTVSPEASAWFRRELGLQDKDYIRLFPRYSSGGGLHPGFSLGIANERPARPAVETEAGGIVFYMEEQDLWYMEGYSLAIEYSKAEDDIEYNYKPVAVAGGVQE